MGQNIKGLEESYRKLVEYKKQKKSLMIVLRNGKNRDIPDANPSAPVFFYWVDELELKILLTQTMNLFLKTR